MPKLKVKVAVLLWIGVFLLCSNVSATPVVQPPDYSITGPSSSFTLDYIYNAGTNPPDTLENTPIGDDVRYQGIDLPTGNNANYKYGAEGTALYSANPGEGIIATDSVGIFPTNDDGTYDPNIGEDEVGLLNGEYGIFNPGAFITTDDLQDVDGDGLEDDPGWIHLGKDEGNGVGYSTLGPLTEPVPWDVNTFTINVGHLLSLKFVVDTVIEDGKTEWGTTGKWELAADPTHRDLVVALMGGASFDHLAFIVKAGQGPSGGGFVIYDFNFNTIFAALGNSALNFDGTYVLGGTFDVTDDLGGKGISHISALARDPNDLAVPEPATMALMGMGLIALAGIGRRRYNK